MSFYLLLHIQGFLGHFIQQIDVSFSSLMEPPVTVSDEHGHPPMAVPTISAIHCCTDANGFW